MSSSGDDKKDGSMTRSPNAIDVSVGKKIRLRRTMLNMTLADVAAKIGVNIRQLAKYESGVNRVGAARLFDIALALEINLMWFFVGGGPSEKSVEQEIASQSALLVDEFSKIKDASGRLQVITLVGELVEAEAKRARGSPNKALN